MSRLRARSAGRRLVVAAIAACTLTACSTPTATRPSPPATRPSPPATQPSPPTTQPSPPTTRPSAPTPRPAPPAITAHLLGLLGANGKHLAGERRAGIDVVTVAVSWDNAEPAPGTFDAAYLRGLRAEVAAVRAADMHVVLDPGLQYPPPWVFTLPGGTRFVNQYGDVFTGDGPSGNNVANAFTDPSVRSAEGSYLDWLGTQFAVGSITAVRQGGGPLGELRYPGPDYNGHTDSYWAYDASTQAASPVPGWKPGTGTPAEASLFLNAYNAAIDGYGRWLNARLHLDFDTTELVLLPGWGERPGGAAAETASLLALPMDEFNEGLDWSDLLDSLPDVADSVAYTTYLDAPLVKPTAQLEDPADYIATLAVGTPLRLGGENTGNGTTASMRLCFQRATTLGYVIVQWMDESQLLASTNGADPSGPTFNLLGAAAASWQAVEGRSTRG